MTDSERIGRIESHMVPDEFCEDCTSHDSCWKCRSDNAIRRADEQLDAEKEK